MQIEKIKGENVRIFPLVDDLMTDREGNGKGFIVTLTTWDTPIKQKY
jgi:predicted phosphatase